MHNYPTTSGYSSLPMRTINKKVGENQRFDFDSYILEWGNYKNFELLKKVCSGQHGEVHLARDARQRQDRCAKILKKASMIRIKRERKILEALNGGPAIIALYEIVKIPIKNNVVFIYEYIDNIGIMNIPKEILCYVLFQIVNGIEFCHERGIMHRNINPSNILVDRNSNSAKLIDWSQAQFYRKGQEYLCDKGSLCYRAPEMIMEMKQYDYTVDMWSYGCVFAGVIFRLEPFFAGSETYELVNNICKFLGTYEITNLLDKYSIEKVIFNRALLDTKPRINFKDLKDDKNFDFASQEAISLIEKMLICDPENRFTAREVISHKYFFSVKNTVKLPPPPPIDKHQIVLPAVVGSRRRTQPLPSPKKIEPQKKVAAPDPNEHDRKKKEKKKIDKFVNDFFAHKDDEDEIIKKYKENEQRKKRALARKMNN